MGESSGEFGLQMYNSRGVWRTVWNEQDWKPLNIFSNHVKGNESGGRNWEAETDLTNILLMKSKRRDYLERKGTKMSLRLTSLETEWL